MARIIKKLRENGRVIYPFTILEAIGNIKTGENLKDMLLNLKDMLLNSKPIAITVTLLASNWIDKKQTITIPDLPIGATIIVSTSENIVEAEEYADCGIYAISQGLNEIIFSTFHTPIMDIVINLEIK